MLADLKNIPNFRFQIPNKIINMSKADLWYSEFGIWNLEFGIWNLLKKYPLHVSVELLFKISITHSKHRGYISIIT